MAIARRERAAVRAHPWMIELVGRHTFAGHIGPNALRHLEQTLAALDTLDAGPEWRLRLVTAVADYATGFVIRETASNRSDTVEPGIAVSNTEQLAAALDQPYLKRYLAEEGFPHVVALLAGGPPPFEDNNFEQGLRWILDGLEAHLR